MTRNADVIFINGSVITVDKDDQVTEATAVSADKITAIGKTVEIRRLAGPDTTVIDLKGRSLLPGFVDAHCHAGMYGVSKNYVQCGSQEVKSIEDIKEAIEKMFNAKVLMVNTFISPKGDKRAYVKFSLDTPAIDIATNLGLV